MHGFLFADNLLDLYSWLSVCDSVKVVQMTFLFVVIT